MKLYILFQKKMQKEFVISVLSSDGKHINMEVKQRNQQISKRKVKTWTTQQDKQLIDVYRQFPKRWTEIAANMPDRNQNQCLHRYRRLIQLGQNHKIWSAEQDETILKMLRKYGKNWKLISEMLGTKNGKQIRERFINKLDPKIKKDDWSESQDRQILQLFSKIGSKWSQISKFIPGRPQNKIKNRFYSYIHKNYDIKFKQVQNIDPKSDLKFTQKPEQTPTKKNPFENLINKSRNIIELKMQVRESHENLISKFQIPSINEIEFDMKMQHHQSNSNILESVFRDDDWRNNNQYNSILELRSQDFFPRHIKIHEQ